MPDRSLRPLTSFPPSWTDLTRDLAGPVTLDIAGYAIAIEITADQLARVYLPLLASLTESTADGRRVLAGLAGIPGGGKSCFAAALAHVAQRVLPADCFMVVGMDGWHWPNAVLDQRTTLDTAGKPIPLRRRKGGPESYDVAALIAALRELRTADRPVRLPVYDRQRHDPVSDVLTVPPETRIVLLEGNYLLNSMPPWDQVGALLEPPESGSSPATFAAGHPRKRLSTSSKPTTD
jgi:pantothenate kinase